MKDSSGKSRKLAHLFTMVANGASQAAGRASTFILACLVIIVWGVTGPLFHYSDTWQLIINTGTTIVTFLMVFLIQNSQNRDSAAITRRRAGRRARTRCRRRCSTRRLACSRRATRSCASTRCVRAGCARISADRTRRATSPPEPHRSWRPCSSHAPPASSSATVRGSTGEVRGLLYLEA